MKKVVLKLNDLSCPSCMSKIQKAVSQQPGVKDAVVMFNAGKVKAEVYEKLIAPEKLGSIVNQLGYQVEKIIVKEA
ncbi:heavy-metal-associated domain-containing protein [Limosilactobacillus mucosae]|uniref:heavy-metal-associated domain-containing protein n=1 Tax=Limosilactobacillus mucosae TaxID=97478 RepID=UPI0022E24135|nr:heavy-metal-associated domain-containing protein [Limosilactobacillus mucosae]